MLTLCLYEPQFLGSVIRSIIGIGFWSGDTLLGCFRPGNPNSVSLLITASQPFKVSVSRDLIASFHTQLQNVDLKRKIRSSIGGLGAAISISVSVYNLTNTNGLLVIMLLMRNSLAWNTRLLYTNPNTSAINSLVNGLL